MTTDDTTPRCIGIDGCRSGWVGATRAGVLVAETLAALLDAAGIVAARDIIAIDIPIGLADTGTRPCDAEARRLLAPKRHASVFSTATRHAVESMDHAEASHRNRANNAGGVSAQAFHLFKKIREVDQLLREQSAWHQSIHEVHPEISFAVMNGTADTPQPMAHPKKSGLGAWHRLTRVFEHFDRAHFEAVRAQHTYSQVADDDIADAYATLYSAERIATGKHRCLPAEPPYDRHGLPMRICY